MYDLKGSKICCPRPRTGQFSRTWRVRDQGQGLDLSRPRTSKTVLKDVLKAKDVLEAAISGQ